MIKLLNQTTEFYCSTEEEAHQVIDNRKNESEGSIVKQSIEVKDNYIKLVIKEEYFTAIELSKMEPTDENEYYEMFDEDGLLIEHKELN